MTDISVNQLEQLSPMQEEHKFGKDGQVLISKSSVLMPFETRNEIDKKNTRFTVQADVLDGDHPFLIGIPTLRKIQAKVDTKNNTLHFAVNGDAQVTKLVPNGNHLYLSNALILSHEESTRETQYCVPRTGEKYDEIIIENLHCTVLRQR